MTLLALVLAALASRPEAGRRTYFPQDATVGLHGAGFLSHDSGSISSNLNPTLKHDSLNDIRFRIASC